MEQKWNPYKSKWKAAIENGIDIPVKETDNILYLGASAGTTVSSVSELTKGIVFAIENAFQMAIPLIRLAEKRKNIAPIFCDARNLETIEKSRYKKEINILFQDIPAHDQIEILEKASALVEKDGLILLSLKTQSISQQDPEKTFKEAKTKLSKKFKIIKTANLFPFHKKHYFFLMKKL